MTIVDILTDAVEQQASDVFLVAGLPLSYKINGEIVQLKEKPFVQETLDPLIYAIYELAYNRDIHKLVDNGDDDFSFAIQGVSRFRASSFKQRGTLAAVIRIVRFDIPDHEKIGIPSNVMSIANMTKGFVLVTGPAGSGKSTTLACLIDSINHTRNSHIITLEDPLEYLHRHNKSVVSQREIATDTQDYDVALRAALRQSPNVILLGEMRDYETIKTAMTAAETGHLLISTLHTVGAAKTIDRIIDAFPPNQQQQIRVQLSMVLQAVVSQQLIPSTDGKVVPAFEVMYLNSAIRNMIRESKIHQIDTVIFSSAQDGMITMDTSLWDLYKAGKISETNLVQYSNNPELMLKKLAR